MMISVSNVSISLVLAPDDITNEVLKKYNEIYSVPVSYVPVL